MPSGERQLRRKPRPRVEPHDVHLLLALGQALLTVDHDELVAWQQKSPGEGGTIYMPHPEYHPMLVAFFAYLSHGPWHDYDYDPVVAGERIREPAYIARADLDALRSLLTYCEHGEHFNDGHWGVMAREGHVEAILRRIRVLHE